MILLMEMNNRIISKKYIGIIFTDLSGPIWSRSIGAYRFANTFLKHDRYVKVIDCITDFNDEEIDTLLNNIFHPNLEFIGFSTTFLNYHQNASENIRNNRNENFLVIKKIVQFVKKTYPDLKIIFGGATSNSYQYLMPDLIVNGYSENLTSEIDSHLKCSYQSHVLKSNNLNFNLEDIEVVYHKDDFIFNKETLTIEISRGCRFKCKFCNYPLNGRKANTYLKDSESLYNELLRNYEDYKITSYFFSDDTFNESVEKLKYVQEILDRLPFKIQFFAYLRLDLIYLYPEMIKILKDMGLTCAFFGIESLNPETTKYIGKGTNSEILFETLSTLKSTWGDDVFITTSFIVGLPYETEETLSSWIPKLLDESFPSDHIILFPLTISFGENAVWESEISQNLELLGYEITKNGFEEFWKNEYLNSSTCAKFIENFYVNYYKKYPTRNLNSSTVISLLGYGISMNEIIKYRNNMNDELPVKIRTAIDNRIEKYKKFQINYLTNE
jgi:radical SAM superfamily enzyme YgiQ (UPF0313 family)